MRGGRSSRPVEQLRAGNGIVQTKPSQERMRGKPQTSRRRNAAPANAQQPHRPQRDVLDDAAVCALIRIDSRSAPGCKFDSRSASGGGKEAKRLKTAPLEGEESDGEDSEEEGAEEFLAGEEGEGEGDEEQEDEEEQEAGDDQEEEEEEEEEEEDEDEDEATANGLRKSRNAAQLIMPNGPAMTKVIIYCGTPQPLTLVISGWISFNGPSCETFFGPDHFFNGQTGVTISFV